MRLLTVAFGSAAEFLVCHSMRPAPGALFCPTRASFQVGEELCLEVWFPGLPNRSILRGRAHTASSGPGGWVRLERADGRARDFLVALARGEASEDPVARGHVRIPANLPVACRIDEIDEPSGQPIVGRTHDVGSGGVFIRAASPPAVGTRVEVVLGPTSDCGARFALDGRVAWIGGDSAGGRGFAVRFDRGGGEAQRLRAMLRRARETGRIKFT